MLAFFVALTGVVLGLAIDYGPNNPVSFVAFGLVVLAIASGFFAIAWGGLVIFRNSRGQRTNELMKTTQRLAQGHNLAAWIEHQVHDLPMAGSFRVRFSGACFIVAQEHHQAILLLLSQTHPLYAPAFALYAQRRAQ